MPDSTSKVRLQRYMADAGVAARRACERLIEEGRVEVNGRVVTKLPAFVDPESDTVVVDGRPVRPPGRRVYIALHKPTRTLVTAADEPGFDRRTVLDLVDHPAKARLFPVGRLHYDATGLVILTNDGEFANLLTHPRYGVPKTYWAVVKGVVVQENIADIDLKLKALDSKASRAAMGLSTGPRGKSGSEKLDRKSDRKSGPRAAPTDPDGAAEGEMDLEVEGLERPRWEREHVAKSTRPAITIVKTGEGKTLLEISMLEARNRQLEDVLQSIGAPVKKVTRVAIGPLRLKGLGVGQWRVLSNAEVTLLRKLAKRGREATGGAKANAIPGAVPAVVKPVPAMVDRTLSRSDRKALRERTERNQRLGQGLVASEQRSPPPTRPNRSAGPDRRAQARQTVARDGARSGVRTGGGVRDRGPSGARPPKGAPRRGRPRNEGSR